MGTVDQIYWTLASIVEKIRCDLDLEEETFIEPDELLGYINEAIDDAERAVMGIYEDYFLTRETTGIVSGVDLVEFPDTIYANKIRRVIYSNGSKVYKIARLRNWHKFEDHAIQNINNNSDLYKYFPINSIPGQPQMLFTPVPNETLPSAIIIWFTRQANRLELDADVMDIPEAYQFIISYAKEKCLFKEKNPAYTEQKTITAKERADLISTLATMVPDGDNEIESDYTHYEEHS